MSFDSFVEIADIFDCNIERNKTKSHFIDVQKKIKTNRQALCSHCVYVNKIPILQWAFRMIGSETKVKHMNGNDLGRFYFV